MQLKVNSSSLLTACAKWSVVIVLSAAIVSRVIAQQDHQTPKRAEAKKTFESVCASCHGLDGRGGERGPDLVNRAEVTGKSNSELGRILSEGKGASGMPSFGALGPQRIAELVGYLRTLQGAKAETRLPGNPARGKALFFGKGKCSDCHMVSGKGGFFAQELTRFAGRRSADEIRAAIVAPNKDLDPRRGLTTAVLADGSQVTGLARNEDNFSLQLQTAEGKFYLLNKSEIRSQRYEGKSGMPADYGEVLSSAELNDLVSFLLRSAATEKTTTTKGADDDFDE